MFLSITVKNFHGSIQIMSVSWTDQVNLFFSFTHHILMASLGHEGFFAVVYMEK